ncbi:MAG: radical SAM protein [Candidatus Acididesulfobacter diazotrophicus]|jgi:radical SAM protein with 4Fe4S-binding SPASM domain|uniref:Radical SAM protein n=1 Tax=Candidatus Acididesulfobacter diazotrophicus TaxID=2597226 RepID=A0A519BJW1_9DELT|nr:MAG: radical SAM protein [Candidatus Acididesulfobacter diazotrophicus]
MLMPTELDYQTEFYYQWHITGKCNLRCKHCYHEDYSEEGLTISELLKIAVHLSDAVKEWGKIGSFSITGGEPFLRKDAVFELLAFFEKRSEIGHVDILSNGTLIDDEIISGLLRFKKLRRIQVSLEGLQETNDKIRGTGSFNLIVNKIKDLSMAGLKTSVMMTIGKHNKDQVGLLAKELADLGVEAFVVDRFIPEGQSAYLNKWTLTPDEIKDAYERCYEYFNKSLKPRMLLYRTLFCLINPDDKHIGAMCSVGNNALTIMPNGDVLPCRRLPLNIGNLLENSIYEIWYKNPLLWEFRDHENLKGKCGKCEYVPVCRGCRAAAYTATGDYLQSDPQCWK